MNYYEHHLGDFAKDAGHLTMLREGAYRRLMDVYYARERPLPRELGAVLELSKCKSRHERSAVESVLREFFELRADGWHQKRCDEEIARFRLKSEKAAQSANMRWHNGGNANALRTQSEGNARERNALQSPISSHHEDIPTPTPSHRVGRGGSRAQGTNLRASGANPRALGTNGRADRDERKAELEEARIVWSELIASGGARPKRDHQIQGALDAIGGWAAVRVRTEHDEVRLQRAFCEAYLRGGESAQKNGAHQPLDPEDLWEREEAARADG